jgi:hypothetical protein
MKLDACRVGGVALRYGDLGTCIARNQANCFLSLGAPDTGRTPANEEACAQAYAGASCADYIQNTIPACQPPAGVRKNGGPCSFSAQCQSAFCAMSSNVACGTCTPPPQVGQSCAATQCGNGQVCAAATMTCQPYGGASAACSTSSECEVGLDCVVPKSGSPGFCQQGGTMVGLACDHKVGPICDYLQGLYCSSTTMTTAGTCIPYLHAMPEQPCGYQAGTATTGASYTECVGGSTCIIPQGMSAGTCIADALEGQPCDNVNGPTCLSPARCITTPVGSNGTCQLVDPTTC